MLATTLRAHEGGGGLAATRTKGSSSFRSGVPETGVIKFNFRLINRSPEA